MLTVYIQAAMRHAHYEIIDDAKPYYGSIPDCQSVLEDWIVLGLRLGHPIPVIDGIAVAPEKLEPIDA